MADLVISFPHHLEIIGLPAAALLPPASKAPVGCRSLVAPPPAPGRGTASDAGKE